MCRPKRGALPGARNRRSRLLHPLLWSPRLRSPRLPPHRRRCRARNPGISRTDPARTRSPRAEKLGLAPLAVRNLVLFRCDVDLVLAAQPRLEVLDRLAKTCADLGEAAHAKDQGRDREDQEQLREADHADLRPWSAGAAMEGAPRADRGQAGSGPRWKCTL